MKARRLTREEQRARTRERILDAAARVFARRGFDGASVDEVAEEAGYSKGAVYSNFESKEDLFLSLLETHGDDLLDEIERRVGSAGDPLERLRAAGSVVEAYTDRGDWCLLFMEMWAFSVRNPRLRPRFAALYQSLRQRSAEAIEAEARTLGVTLPVPAEDLATAAVAMGDGFALQKLADPKRFPEGYYASLLLLLFGALGAPAANAASPVQGSDGERKVKP